MKINKSKLMKKAWENAKNEFYKKALYSLIGVKNQYAIISERSIKDTCRYPLREKENYYNAPHIQKARNAAGIHIDFSVRDFLSAGLKLAWRQMKKLAVQEQKEAEQAEIEAFEERKKETTKKINADAPRRRLVPADKYDVMDNLGKFIITGLGTSFKPHREYYAWQRLGKFGRTRIPFSDYENLPLDNYTLRLDGKSENDIDICEELGIDKNKVIWRNGNKVICHVCSYQAYKEKEGEDFSYRYYCSTNCSRCHESKDEIRRTCSPYGICLGNAGNTVIDGSLNMRLVENVEDVIQELEDEF